MNYTLSTDGFVTITNDKVTRQEDFLFSCPDCRKTECLIDPLYLFAIVAVTCVIVVAASILYVFQPLSSLSVKHFRSTAMTWFLLTLVTLTPLLILLTDKRTKFVQHTSQPAEILSWEYDKTANAIKFACYPAYTDIMLSEPFLETSSDGTTACQETQFCWNNNKREFDICPGQWTGIKKNTFDHLVPEAPWFFMGNYFVCGNAQLQSCPDWEGQPSVLFGTDRDATGRLYLLCSSFMNG